MNNQKIKIMIENYNLIDLLDGNKSTGGACVQLHATALGLKDVGCDVNVLVTKSSNKLKEYSKYNIIELYDKDKGIKFFKWLYYRFPRIINIIKNNRPDIIIQQCAGINTFLYAVIAKIVKSKFVYFIANDMELDGRIFDKLNAKSKSISYYINYCFSNIIYFFYKTGLRLTDLIVCQNHYQYKFVKRGNYKKSVVLYNAYKIPNLKNEDKKQNEREYVAWIGKLVYQKNLPDLYYIAKKNTSLCFKIAGELGNSNIDEETLVAIDKLKLLTNVSFEGQLSNDDIIPFLSKAKFLLNTSHYEGFSNTFLEAISVGTPIVTLGVNPDNILNKYKLGYVITKENFSELIQKNLNFFDYVKYSNNATSYLKKFHDNKIIAKKILNNCIDI